MNMDDNDGQMIFGDIRGLKLPYICRRGEENPRETSPRKLVPTGNRTRARYVTGAHATSWTTGVDIYRRKVQTKTNTNGTLNNGSQINLTILVETTEFRINFEKKSL